ncbi:MAG: electron transfer flavoprotein subunit alpha/FixB family protein, partial [Bacteriovoracaceae bacterium]
MANILVYTEMGQETVKSVTLEILGKLAGHTLDVVAIGDLSDKAKEDLAKFGAANIHVIKGDHLGNYSPEGYASALKGFLGSNSYDYVFAGSTSLGKDLFPRLSGEFNAGMASEVVNFQFEGDQFFGTRPLFAGKCLAKVEIKGPKPHFVTVRPNALGLPESPTAGAGSAQDHSAEASEIR